MTRTHALFLVPLLALAIAAHPAPAAAATIVPDGFTDELVADSLSQPCGIGFLPDGRLLVVEQLTASIKLLAGPAMTPLLAVGTVSNVNTSGNGERGLLGVAADPAWPARPYLYVHSTSKASGDHLRISRYTCTGDLEWTGNGAFTIVPASRYDVIADVVDGTDRHNGGTVRFGPDGKLYVSLGEDNDPCAAQDPTTLHGVILRVDVSGLPAGAGSATRAQITPADNPFVGSANENERLVWAYGLRNPFRFQVDRVSGDLYVADVGAAAYEELDRIEAGGHDLGWPFLEGTVPWTTCPVTPPPFTSPIFSYDRRPGLSSIIAAALYRPPPSGGPRQFPAEYSGDAFFSDYYQGYLCRLQGSGTSWSLAAPVPGQPTTDHWGEGFQYISDYQIGPDGALWYCMQANSLGYASGTGQIHRINGSGAALSVPGPRSALQRVSSAYPVPSHASVRIDFTLSRAASASMTIHDLSGRTLRHLMLSGLRTAGGYSQEWDGLDDTGRVVESGLYFARLAVDGERFERRIVLVR
jgi:glucose/arabinose dehydrogenase